MSDRTPFCCYAKEGPTLEQLEGPADALRCRSVQELAVLLEVCRTIEKSFDLHDIAQPVLKNMQNLMGLQSGAITLVNPDNGEMAIDEAIGLPREGSENYLKMIHATSSKVIETGMAQVVDVRDWAGRKTDAFSASEVPGKLTVLLCVPIRSEREIIGTMSAERAGTSRVSQDSDLRLVSMIASLIGQAARVRLLARGQISSLREENLRLQEQVSSGSRPSNMIGTSSAMREVYYLVEQVADSRTTVLIRGESGTGKELVAKALHDHSQRKEGPFVKFNCAA
ncbi:MAG: sigma 54-interacting transcriptional regulator, partial [Opitutales bacterium]